MSNIKCLRIGTMLCILLMTTGCSRSENPRAADTKSSPPAASQITTPAKATPVNTSGPLDGRTFVGELMEQGKKGDSDELTFADGLFRSKGCDQYGFAPSPYTTSVSGDVTSWSATSTSANEGTMVWSGTVQGEVIKGTTVWTKEGQGPITYSFTGTLRK